MKPLVAGYYISACLIFMSILWILLVGCPSTGNRSGGQDDLNSPGKESVGQPCSDGYVQPTGTYLLDRDTTMKEDDFYGTMGRIQVKMISEGKLILAMGILNGAPGYHSGFFIDTLHYDYTTAIYTAPVNIDAECRIGFQFSDDGVSVVQSPKASPGGCGFGQGVTADGFFVKISSEAPVFQHYLTGELLGQENE